MILTILVGFILIILAMMFINSVVSALLPKKKEKIAFKQLEDGTLIQVDYPKEPMTFWRFFMLLIEWGFFLLCLAALYHAVVTR